MQMSGIPSLNWLRVFDAAARHQSFASAGRELNMSAAAVSQQVLALETYFKRPLFERSANSVRLTIEGDEFLPTVQVSLRAIEAKAAALFPRKDVERVTLVASQLMTMSWLPRVVSVFEQTQPSAQVELLMEDIQRQVVPDLTIRCSEEPGSVRHPGWLMGLTHVVVGRPTDVAEIHGADDLARFRLLEVRSHAVGWNTLLARYPGLAQRHVFKIDAVETTPLALAMVREGLVLALVPWPVSRQLLQSMGLAVCSGIPGVAGAGNYVVELARDRSSRKVVQELFQALRQAAASDRDLGVVS
ncbi:LysR family transcriptional regulator [Mesorhizobium sp. B2-5-13]|nr:LysR family transcriptional regulator [Mesorhizobium sp. B2-5-13]TPK45861.1 LysR family transcriptional regulator [Mesorhizobium sp. B2-5-5]